MTAENYLYSGNTSGSVELSFTIDSAAFGEKPCGVRGPVPGRLLLVSHADLEDEAQSVRYPGSLGILRPAVEAGLALGWDTSRPGTARICTAGESLALAATMLVCLILWRKRQRKACTVKE